MFNISGKYRDDLNTVGKHAIKSQNYLEQRSEVPYKPMYKQFITSEISFDKQYNTFYEMRLKDTRVLLVDVVKQKWGKDVKIMSEIRLLQPHTKCVIIGTIYKDLSFFKSILNEKAASSFNPQLIGTQFLPKSSIRGPLSQATDPIILEDSTTRILIKSFPHSIVTGVVCAVLGEMDENGDFSASDVCYLHDQIVKHESTSFEDAKSSDPYLCLLSGLNITKTISLRTHMLFEYIASQLGFVEDIQIASHIARIMLVGNSVNLLRLPFQRIRQDNNEIADATKCIENLDLLLSQILPSVAVTVIPGATDASSILMPQQPLHPSLLLRSMRYSSLECATNPYEACINGITVLATSGQNIQDIARQITPELSIIDIMALTLQWGAIFPTNPNTCPGTLYDTTDPFIIRQLPDIYIVGNQSSFEMERRCIGGKDVLLIALPTYSTTGDVVMLNLRTKEADTIHFSSDLVEEMNEEMNVEEHEEEDVVIDEDIANEEQ